MNKYKKVSELTLDEIYEIKSVYDIRLSTFFWKSVCYGIEAKVFPYYISRDSFDNDLLDFSKVNYTEYPELALELFKEEKERHYNAIEKLEQLEQNVKYSDDKYTINVLDQLLKDVLDLKDLALLTFTAISEIGEVSDS